MRLLLSILTGLFLLSMLSCKSDPKPQTNVTPPKPAKQVTIPKFDRDLAYSLIEKQLAFGPRVPNSSAHKETRDYLIESMKGYGAKVIAQDFTANRYDGLKMNGTNIIASFNPDHKKRILLAAHWDSRFESNKETDPKKKKMAVPAADDGASGVAVLQTIAKHLQDTPIDMGIDIMFIDLEDQGDSGDGENFKSWCLGAQHWANNFHVPGYNAKFGILLDMVGAKDAQFTKEKVSMSYAQVHMNKVWSLAQKMGYGNYFLDQDTRAAIDDHLFINQEAGIPMLDIINYTNDGFGDHWHTQADNIDVIDKRTLKAVGQTVLAVIYNESMGRF